MASPSRQPIVFPDPEENPRTPIRRKKGPSPVMQLIQRLGDPPGLMDDRFYVSALLETDADIEAAARLIEGNQDFDLIPESDMENLPTAEVQDDDAMISAEEVFPSRDEIGLNPGPWNPRPYHNRNLTTAERTALTHFEDIAYLRVIDGDIVRHYLEECHWVVTTAYDRWEADRTEVIRRNQGQQSSQPDTAILKTMLESGVPFNDNIEQERRDAARVLRDEILRAMNHSSDYQLCISEAVLLLHEVDWNLAAALRKFTHREDSRERLSVCYDGMRLETSSRTEQDHRLAIMTTITQRVDLYALEQLLHSNKWDLIKAIVSWFTNGVAPLRHPKDRDTSKLNKGYYRRKTANGTIRPMPSKAETEPAARSEKGWASEPKEYAAKAAQKKEQPQPSASKTTGGLGAVINGDLRPITPGPPRPVKLEFEAISKGKYRQGTFLQSKYRWVDQDHPDFSQLNSKAQASLLSRPKFDWRNRDHLDDLNKWRRQKYLRATSRSIRPGSQPFSQAENDFLYKLSKELVEEEMKRTGKSWEECRGVEVRSGKKQEWQKRFNEKFAGTMPDPHKKPLLPRNADALMTQRSRYQKTRDDFKIGKVRTFKRAGNKRGGAGGDDNDDDNNKGSPSGKTKVAIVANDDDDTANDIEDEADNESEERDDEE